MDTATNDPCRTFDLNALIEQTLGEKESRKVEDHLANCQRCQTRLLSEAGGDAWPQFMKEYAKYRNESRDAPNQQIDEDCFAEDNLRTDPTGVLIRLLPSDDPRMLGRIGPYEVTGLIGSGGMGAVLKAVDPALQRTVAIKVLLPALSMSGVARQRFAREAQAIAAVTHQNVIAVHSVQIDGDLPYLVMPLIRGESLQQRLDRDGPYDVIQTLRIGVQIAAGLSAAHEQGLVHRDIKPANVLIEAGTQRLTITDFGLVRAIDDAGTTRSGIITGTPQFMSPEQIQGQRVDERTDLFSLGALLYTASTGRPPFSADSSYAILHRIVTQEPPSIRELRPELPPWFAELVQWLMRKDPDERPASASKVQALMTDCLAHLQHANRELPAELNRSIQAARWGIKPIFILLLACLATTVGISLRSVDFHSTDIPEVSPGTSPGKRPIDTVPFDWSDNWLDPLNELESELKKLEQSPVPWKFVPSSERKL